MGMLHGTRRALLSARKKYYQRVLGTNPIAYWTMWESSGPVSQDLVLAAQNGVYTGVSFDPSYTGIGDGNTAPLFDGINDFNNIYTPTFAGRFNGSEGTMMAWARVANVEVWGDGIVREPIRVLAAGTDFILVRKEIAGNISFYYMAGGVLKAVSYATSSIDWFHMAMTWSKSAGVTGEVTVYIDGIQTGATQVGLGMWAGTLVSSQTTIGAAGTVPASVWHGYLAHVPVWDRALTPATIKSLAVV